MGRLGLSYQDFFILTIKEIGLILKGYDEKIQGEWEMARMSGALSVLPHLKKGAKLDVKKLWPLPWDKETGLNTIDLQAALKAAKEKYKKLKNG
jgi:hypothetical protein